FVVGFDAAHDHAVVQGTELGFRHIFLVGAGRAASVGSRLSRSERLLALALNECQQARWTYGVGLCLSSALLVPRTRSSPWEQAASSGELWNRDTGAGKMRAVNRIAGFSRINWVRIGAGDA